MNSLRQALRFIAGENPNPPAAVAGPSTAPQASPNMEEIDSSFVLCPTDVLAVKSILWKKNLPLELINPILEFAEYWPGVLTEVEKTINVSHNGNVLYLRTQPLPGLFTPENLEADEDGEQIMIGDVEVKTVNPVRKVVFRTWSKDQGWSSNPGRGTYIGSHSWFEAFVERPTSVATVKNASPLETPVDMAEDKPARPMQEAGGLPQIRIPTPPPNNENPPWRRVTVSRKIKGPDGLEDSDTEKKEWHVQHNIHADRVFKKHEVIWTWADNDEDEDKEVENNEQSTGAGKGGSFVRCLKSGDRIGVCARAMYPGWANNVRKIQVEVYYSI